jgi:hypothetical protein
LDESIGELADVAEQIGMVNESKAKLTKLRKRLPNWRKISVLSGGFIKNAKRNTYFSSKKPCASISSSYPFTSYSQWSWFGYTLKTVA